VAAPRVVDAADLVEEGRAPHHVAARAGFGGDVRREMHDFARVLGAPVLLMGFGLPGENAHAPNEWMSDENFVKGMQAAAAFWDELGA